MKTINWLCSFSLCSAIFDGISFLATDQITDHSWVWTMDCGLEQSEIICITTMWECLYNVCDNCTRFQDGHLQQRAKFSRDERTTLITGRGLVPFVMPVQHWWIHSSCNSRSCTHPVFINKHSQCICSVKHQLWFFHNLWFWFLKFPVLVSENLEIKQCAVSIFGKTRKELAATTRLFDWLLDFLYKELWLYTYHPEN
jgi:hypothetical protein